MCRQVVINRLVNVWWLMQKKPLFHHVAKGYTVPWFCAWVAGVSVWARVRVHCAVSQLDLVRVNRDALFTHGKHQRPAEDPHNVLHQVCDYCSLPWPWPSPQFTSSLYYIGCSPWFTLLSHQWTIVAARLALFFVCEICINHRTEQFIMHWEIMQLPIYMYIGWAKNG
jgi:hypothetical protein